MVVASQYEHISDSVIGNERCKILRDFHVQTDKVIEHRRPDIVCIDKIAKSCLIIDIAIPGDQNIIAKEHKKIDKCQNLRTELGKLRKLQAKVVPVVVGALGIISHNLKLYLEKIDILTITSCLQKTAILRT